MAVYDPLESKNIQIPGNRRDKCIKKGENMTAHSWKRPLVGINQVKIKLFSKMVNERLATIILAHVELLSYFGTYVH